MHNTGFQGKIKYQIQIKPVVNKDVMSYLKNDVVNKDLRKLKKKNKYNFTGDKWLKESEPKRCIFFKMYYDLMKKNSLNILDVGGGVNSLMKKISPRNDYTLIEIMNHEKVDKVRQFIKKYKIKWINKSWHEVQPSHRYDIILANDLFPNVDQRIEAFINTYLPLCNEMRLSITTYPNDKYYKVKRVDDDEIFFVQPWTKIDFLNWVNRYFALELDIKNVFPKNTYVHPNSRSVVLLKIKKKAAT